MEHRHPPRAPAPSFQHRCLKECSRRTARLLATPRLARATLLAIALAGHPPVFARKLDTFVPLTAPTMRPQACCAASGVAELLEAPRGRAAVEGDRKDECAPPVLRMSAL